MGDKVMKKFLYSVFIVLLFIRCAAVIYDKSSVQYIKDDFSSDDLYNGGLAILPVVSGQGQEGYRRPFGEALNRGINTMLPRLHFLPWQQTMNILNQHGLVEDYQKAILSYRETAILDKNLILKIGEALDLRYLLFVSLEEFHKTSQTDYNILVGFHTTKTARINGFAQIWDCTNGDIVWEGIGLAESKGGDLTYEKDYTEYAKIAANGLVKLLPKVLNSKSSVNIKKPIKKTNPIYGGTIIKIVKNLVLIESEVSLVVGNEYIVYRIIDGQSINVGDVEILKIQENKIAAKIISDSDLGIEIGDIIRLN